MLANLWRSVRCLFGCHEWDEGFYLNAIKVLAHQCKHCGHMQELKNPHKRNQL